MFLRTVLKIYFCCFQSGFGANVNNMVKYRLINTEKDKLSEENDVLVLPTVIFDKLSEENDVLVLPTVIFVVITI